MKLFDYHHVYDYGHEWYLNVFCTRLFNLFQFNLDWSHYAARPLFLMNILGESLIGFSFSVYKLTISFDFLAYRQRELDWYRQ
jgi:hypothetical protein